MIARRINCFLPFFKQSGGVVRHEFVDAAQYYSFLIEGVLEEAWGVVRV
jgi:hypothetical protein